MKSGWQTKKIGEILKLEYGKPLPKSKRKNDGLYPVYGANGEKDKSDEYYVDKPSIIVGRKGSAGELTLSEGKFWPLDVTYYVIFDEKKHDLKFLYYLLCLRNLPSLAKGVKPGINRNEVYSISVHAPTSLAEQKRIVSILDESFEAIEKARENAEKNLNNAYELFESYLKKVFVNLDEKYGVEKFGEVCAFVRGPFGGSLKKEIFKRSGYAVYEQQHAIYNQFVHIRYFIDEDKFEEMKRFELHPGELIMSCSGTMGKVAIVPEGIKRGVINQALLKLTPSKKVLNVFLKYWMASQSFQDSLKEYSQGAAIKNVASVKVLKNIKIPLPPIPIQQSIIAKLDELSEQSESLKSIYQQKLADLGELKQSLLTKAFAGEL